MQSVLLSEQGQPEQKYPRPFARNVSRTIMPRMLTGFLMVGGFLCSINTSTGSETPTPQDTRPLELRYDKPANDWEHDALPLGNGRLGAMVFGGIDEERIALNEDTLWSGKPFEGGVTSGKHLMPKIRELVLSSQLSEASELTKQLQGGYTQSYQPLGNLRLSFCNQGVITDYRRTLDIERAVAEVQYRVDGKRQRRTIFVSHPDQVIVIQLESEQPGGLNFTASLDSLLIHRVESSDRDGLIMRGHAPVLVQPNYLFDHPEPIVQTDAFGNSGMRFCAHLKVRHTGGNISWNDQHQLVVSGADRVTILLAADTSFNGFDKSPSQEGIDETVEPLRDLKTALELTDSELLSRHEKDYRNLFDRVKFDLGGLAARGRLTPSRLQSVRSGEADLDLVTLLFQYGRYLMISSSREGTQPANLQGIWSQSQRPPWSANYTVNINTEMNYWPAESTNLSECHEPLLKMIRELSVTGADTANKTYGMGGWVAHHNVDIWRHSCPVGDFGKGIPVWACWQMGGAWLCQHLWDHYDFTRDETFLKQVAYPVMKGAALFLLDYLVEDNEGHLVSIPSTSPENSFYYEGETLAVAMASTMDMSITRNLFSNVIKASEVLGIDSDLRDRLREANSRLYPLQVGKNGRLQEWYLDFEEAEPHHRHVSHLFGLYPGEEISPLLTKEWAEAAKQSLIARGDDGTGWSKAWKISLWARLLDGQHAYKLLLDTLKISTNDNFLNSHPPFQIDGNFGATAGIVEMLLQSHQDEIHLLPAIPSEWAQGSIHGLRARGGITVDIDWSDGRIKTACLSSDIPQTVRVRHGEDVFTVKLEPGRRSEVSGLFDTVACSCSSSGVPNMKSVAETFLGSWGFTL